MIFESDSQIIDELGTMLQLVRISPFFVELISYEPQVAVLTNPLPPQLPHLPPTRKLKFSLLPLRFLKMVSGFVYFLEQHVPTQPSLAWCHLFFLKLLPDNLKYLHVLLSHWDSFGKRILVPFGRYLLKEKSNASSVDLCKRVDFLRIIAPVFPGVVSWMVTRRRNSYIVGRRKTSEETSRGEK